ncbi:MAG: hypothetical protein WC086_01725, partial [Dehalococcoidales bacterium]
MPAYGHNPCETLRFAQGDRGAGWQGVALNEISTLSSRGSLLPKVLPRIVLLVTWECFRIDRPVSYEILRC